MADHIFGSDFISNHRAFDPLAKRLNKMQQLIQEHDHEIANVDPDQVLIRWVRLTQAIGPTSNFANRTGVIQYLDTSTNKFRDISSGETLSVCTDPLAALVYPVNSIIAVLAHSSGKYVPLSAPPTLLGKTTGAVTALVSTTAYKIYTGTMGSETDSGLTVPSAVCRVAVSTGKWIELTWTNNAYWEMKPLECP